MNAEIVHTQPDIYDVLHQKFGVTWDGGVIITVFPNIYCKFDLPAEKVIHEVVHLKQQEIMKPNVWWHKYLNEPSFRLEQEIEAYKKEVVFIKQTIKDRNTVFQFIHQIAKDLSGSMYGKIITYSDALKLLK